MAKPKVATTSLAGCFGCHMSLLDIDERILELVELVEFDKSPINDIKTFTGPCAVGLIEGGCCNEENVRGAAGLPQALRHPHLGGGLRHHGRHPGDAEHMPLKECLEEAYLNGPTCTIPAAGFRTTGDPAPAGQGVPVPTRW
jgi:NAD-reducing hydrogenase small subunit